MTYQPTSCFADPVEARWGHLVEDPEDRHERIAEAGREARYYEVLGEGGLSDPLFATTRERDGFLAELAEGVRTDTRAVRR